MAAVKSCPMSYDFSRIKLLIVDDMPPMLTLVVNLMGRFGFSQVHGAKSVEEAYALFKTHSHDLVVTDWLMEPEDGLDLIEKIRQDRYSPNRFVPIILMTAYADRARVALARDSGITEFLMKPFTAADMYARIVQVIERPRQYVENADFFGPDRRRRRTAEGQTDISERRRGSDDRESGGPDSSDRTGRS